MDDSNTHTYRGKVLRMGIAPDMVEGDWCFRYVFLIEEYPYQISFTNFMASITKRTLDEIALTQIGDHICIVLETKPFKSSLFKAAHLISFQNETLKNIRS